MPKKQSTSNPPPIMPGLKLVETGKTFTEGGRTYRIVKLVREARSDVSYNVKHKAFNA